MTSTVCVHRRRSLVEEAPEGEEEKEEEKETSFCIYFVRKAFLSPFFEGRIERGK